MEIIFLYLNAFEYTGGIQKFNRSFIKAINDLKFDRDLKKSIVSMHDSFCDKNYCDKNIFEGYNKNKIKFVFNNIIKSIFAKKPTIILGHINLSIIGIVIKLIRPSAKVILIAHGIEIWGKISWLRKLTLQKIDTILAVSQFTKDQIAINHGINPHKIIVFHNTIDPYFEVPTEFYHPIYLQERYDFDASIEFVISTVARLSSSEKYKGYDLVIKSLAEIKKENPDFAFKYLIIGKHDPIEFDRISLILKEEKLENNVALTGFVSEEELTDHYLVSDLFVMPSKKEGFGIVFIEAMVCGIQVLAGNKDGSVDALRNGELGTLCDPNDYKSIKESVLKLMKESKKTIEQKLELQQKTLSYFSYEKFKTRLQDILIKN